MRAELKGQRDETRLGNNQNQGNGLRRIGDRLAARIDRSVAQMRDRANKYRTKAESLMKRGLPDLANHYLDKAARLNQAVKTRTAAAVRSLQGGAASAATATAAQPAAKTYASISSAAGRNLAKTQIATGNFFGAMETLKRMEAQANRSGVMGLVDGYRKWRTKGQVLGAAYKTGKLAGQLGDGATAYEAAATLQKLGKPGFFTDRKVGHISTAMVKAAMVDSKTGRHAESQALLSLASKLTPRSQLLRSPNVAKARDAAKARLMKDMGRTAKAGDAAQFRAMRALAAAYAQEEGRNLTKSEVDTFKRLQLQVNNESWRRDLRDIKALTNPRSQEFNPELAEAKLLQASETFARRFKDGHVKTRLTDRVPFNGFEDQFRRAWAGVQKAKGLMTGAAAQASGLKSSVAALNPQWVAQMRQRAELEAAESAE